MAQVGTLYQRHTQWKGYDTVVIGSGIGGLAVAVLLACFDRWWVLVLEQHYPSPLVFLSFGSARDPDFPPYYPGRTTLQVIVPTWWEGFHPWAHLPWQRRGEVYQALEERFAERMLQVPYRMVPQVKGYVVHAELSTPLSTQYFTGHPKGAIYGLNPSPVGFREPWLAPTTPVSGLYLTGSDVITAGMARALAGGLLTASMLLRRNLAAEGRRTVTRARL